MSAVGSDMGAGLAICLCPVIVGHFFGNQALPLSILISSFEQEDS